jgi:hypothetical protein
MYTEEHLSEFLIRARLKIGDFALKLTTLMESGGDTGNLVFEATFLRLFMNALNSDTCDWTEKEKYRRMEYFVNRYGLLEMPNLHLDWLNLFNSIPIIDNTRAKVISIPDTGYGFMYMENEVIKYIPDNRLTLHSLPNS